MTAVARLASHYLAQDQMLVAESHVNMFISNLRKGPLEVNVLMHAKNQLCNIWWIFHHLLHHLLKING